MGKGTICWVCVRGVGEGRYEGEEGEYQETVDERVLGKKGIRKGGSKLGAEHLFTVPLKKTSIFNSSKRGKGVSVGLMGEGICLHNTSQN